MTDHGDRPLPRPDERSRPFFDGARLGKLRIQHCPACGTSQLPGRFACDECLSEELEWAEASGRGSVFTFTIVHQKYHPAFTPPYNVAVVQLEEGPRLLTSIVGVENEDIRAGMEVEVEFEAASDEVSLPRFRPTGR